MDAFEEEINRDDIDQMECDEDETLHAPELVKTETHEMNGMPKASEIVNEEPLPEGNANLWLVYY